MQKRRWPLRARTRKRRSRPREGSRREGRQGTRSKRKKPPRRDKAAESHLAAARADGEARLAAAQAMNAGLMESVEGARQEVKNFEARLQQLEKERTLLLKAKDEAGARLQAETIARTSWPRRSTPPFRKRTWRSRPRACRRSRRTRAVRIANWPSIASAPPFAASIARRAPARSSTRCSNRSRRIFPKLPSFWSAPTA